MTGDTDNHAAPGGDEVCPPASRHPTVAVIIPAYNEQGAVRATVDDVRRALAAANVSHHIIVVNDGSRDETAAQAKRRARR